MATDDASLRVWIRDRYIAMAIMRRGCYPSKRALADKLASNKEGYSRDEIEKTISDMISKNQLSHLKMSRLVPAAAASVPKPAVANSAGLSMTAAGKIAAAKHTSASVAVSVPKAPAIKDQKENTAPARAKDVPTSNEAGNSSKADDVSSFFNTPSRTGDNEAVSATVLPLNPKIQALKNYLAIAAPATRSAPHKGDGGSNRNRGTGVGSGTGGKATEVDDLINLGDYMDTLAIMPRAVPPPNSVAQQQMRLLGMGNDDAAQAPGAHAGSGAAAAAASGTHALANAPLFSAHALRGSRCGNHGGGGEGDLDVAEDVFGRVSADVEWPVMSIMTSPMPMLSAPAVTPPAQYGLLGLLDPDALGLPLGYGAAAEAAHNRMLEDSRLFMNTNVPFSTFICGVQGSGKSHTMSCLIENCILPSPILGELKKPLAVLLFHYTQCASRLSFRPSEAAFLAFPVASAGTAPHPTTTPPPPQVTVLAAPSNFRGLRALYSAIPGVRVLPFRLRARDLNISTMLTLMATSAADAQPPLYMGVVTRVLRQMAAGAATAAGFDYVDFKRRLGAAGLTHGQLEFLKQRLELLESFLDLDGDGSDGGEAYGVSAADRAALRRLELAPGSVTIIDMSCPFVDANTACVMFKIGMDMFLDGGRTRDSAADGQNAAVGKVIAVDEAHKYMTDTPAARALTESLLSVIRQQRHYGARIIVSTQEPTISPRLIDLCSVTVIHRFTSPQWFATLRRHISVADMYSHFSEDDDDYGDDGLGARFGAGYGVGGGGGFGGRFGGRRAQAAAASTDALFRQILSLQTGEALIFAPSAIVARSRGGGGGGGGNGTDVGDEGISVGGSGMGDYAGHVGDGAPAVVMDRLLKVRIRKRLTWDGGHSVVCVEE